MSKLMITGSGLVVTTLLLGYLSFESEPELEFEPRQNSSEKIVEQATKKNPFFSNDANWWKKKQGHASSKNHKKVKTKAAEKLSEFLIFSPSQEWQPEVNKDGIAIARYQLEHKNQDYQLAIIRMKKVIPLASIMNIWQQKSGLPSVEAFTPVKEIQSAHQQTFSLYQMNGSKQSIALMVHEGDKADDKYTFFRLSSVKSIDAQVMQKLTDLITSAEII